MIVMVVCMMLINVDVVRKFFVVFVYFSSFGLMGFMCVLEFF